MVLGGLWLADSVIVPAPNSPPNTKSRALTNLNHVNEQAEKPMRFATVVVVVARGGVSLPRASLCCTLAALASARRALLLSSSNSTSCQRIALVHNVTNADASFLRQGGAAVREVSSDAAFQHVQRWPEPVWSFVMKLLPVGWTEYDGVLLCDWDMFFEKHQKPGLLWQPSVRPWVVHPTDVENRFSPSIHIPISNRTLQT